jgi:hypothetical protein
MQFCKHMAAMHAVAPALLLLNAIFAFLKPSIREKMNTIIRIRVQINSFNSFNSSISGGR